MEEKDVERGPENHPMEDKAHEKILTMICPLSFCKNIHYIISCLNFLLLVIVTLSPYWMVHPSGESEFVMGLWCYCNELKCTIIPISSEYLDIVRTLMILAVICCLIALVSSRSDKKERSLFSFLANFIAGFCILSSVLIADKYFKGLVEDIELMRYWDFGFACFVCVMCFLLGTLNLFCFVYCILTKKRLHRITPVQESVPPENPVELPI